MSISIGVSVNKYFVCQQMFIPYVMFVNEQSIKIGMSEKSICFLENKRHVTLKNFTKLSHNTSFLARLEVGLLGSISLICFMW